MDINTLTLGNLKEIQDFLSTQPPTSTILSGSTGVFEAELHGYPVGHNVIVRTITMIYTGKLLKVTR